MSAESKQSDGAVVPPGKYIDKYGNIEDEYLTVQHWATRWEKRRIGFHLAEPNPGLCKNLHHLTNGASALKIFVPLCGKSVDLKYLMELGHKVVGVEAVQMGVEEFFADNNIPFSKQPVAGLEGKGVLYQSNDGMCALYCCDLYDFNEHIHGQFDAIWDRGSLVAINPTDRRRYADLMLALMAPGCRYLLDAIEYDQEHMPPPPHSIPEHVLQEMYGEQCDVVQMETWDTVPEWKAKAPKLRHAREYIALIQRRGSTADGAIKD